MKIYFFIKYKITAAAARYMAITINLSQLDSSGPKSENNKSNPINSSNKTIKLLQLF